ncbi:MAG: hypothetical protein QOG35_142 [Solirubrobacteraceae bacterium]|nr:hypothetical protein [Solirubrobacteraceae bacterium]
MQEGRGVAATIAAVRGPAFVLLAAALAALAWPGSAGAAGTILVLDAQGRVHARIDPFLPPPDPLPARAPRAVAEVPGGVRARTAQAQRTVPGELDAMRDAGYIDQAQHDAWTAGYDSAKATLENLHGLRRRQLAAVLANSRAMAAGGLLTASRAPGVFQTLERNRAWWTAAPLLAPAQRVGFAGSQLVWQYYPGQGLQVQWLGTFGKANGLFKARNRDAELHALLDEALSLAGARAGGIAWESLFRFGGGRPPWVSALSQGTAIQVITRAAVRFQDPTLFAAARSALGIFRTPPPEGVLVPTAVGAHYLQYSFAPNLHILNGFIQSLNGLHDFAVLANDPDGRALFAAGEAEARVEVPTFDTGAWSLYSQPGTESDLGYHVLLRDFLQGLCDRLRTDAAKAQEPVTGGTPAAPVPDPALYCDTATRFTAYLRQPPVLAVLPTTVRLRRPSRVLFTLNKRSTVTLTLLRAGRPVTTKTGSFGYGRRAIAFRPSRPGALELRLRAVDPAGNAVEVTGSIEVLRAK